MCLYMQYASITVQWLVTNLCVFAAFHNLPNQNAGEFIVERLRSDMVLWQQIVR